MQNAAARAIDWSEQGLVPDSVIGVQNKYSCCQWSDNTTNLDGAEIEALQMTGEHAGLRDGMNILDSGRGWGLLTTWMARYYSDH